MSDIKDNLFADFPPVSGADWEAKIMEDLKGGDYEKRLVWKTLEGFKIKPYYCADDIQNLKYFEQAPGTYPFKPDKKADSNSWEIRQDFKVYDVASASSKAGLAARRGVTSVGFDLPGLNKLTGELLDNIDLNKINLNFIIDFASADFIDQLEKTTTSVLSEQKKLKGSVNFDPIGNLTVSGGFYESEEEDLNILANLVKSAIVKFPDLRTVTINGQHFGNAGASVVQELAFSLSMASDYITRLTDRGIALKDLVSRIQLSLSVGSNYFLEIAKIRAARLLWTNLLQGFDQSITSDASVYIQSITTDWNKTIYDPYVNLLRATTEAMASVLGGTDALLVQPFDQYFREPGDFSERLARNIQIILKEESYFDRVVDPAAGSYYIESITDAICEHAWNLFLQINEKGGYVKSFTAGFIQDEINKISEERNKMVATRREFLLGTNQYPDFNEQLKGQIEPGIVFPSQKFAQNRIAEPVKITRAALDYEKLRLATEDRKQGRPKVFMLTYGNLAMRLARSQFSCNFFACGGYEVIDNLGFKTAEEGVDAALKVKADIIVICSSDEEYATFVPLVFQLAKDKAIVTVAGAPACMDDLKQKGIENFIHVRSNVTETLKQYHQKLGINIKP